MKQASKSYLLHELVRQEEELKAKVQEAEFAKAAVLDELNKLNKVLEKQLSLPSCPKPIKLDRLRHLLEQAQCRKHEAE